MINCLKRLWRRIFPPPPPPVQISKGGTTTLKEMSEFIREFYLPVVQEHFNNRARETDVFFAMMTGFWGTKQMDFFEYYKGLANNPWEVRNIEKTRKAIRCEW